MMKPRTPAPKSGLAPTSGSSRAPRSEEPEIEKGVRLNVYIARSGAASRRAADKLIQEGRIRVNGAVVTELGSRVGPSDRVELAGRVLVIESRKRYILLNKPRGYICAMSDPQGRPLAIDLIKADVRERVYNVGRLDQWSSGLLLFTNDGELASAMVRPRSGIEKEYEVFADAELGEDFFSSFRTGFVVDGVRYTAAQAVRVGPSSARIVLIEGKNREIRRVLEAFGRRALSLTRIRIGPLTIHGLREGEYRDLAKEEITSLKMYTSVS
jgi:23S rRNA pseudouridine2605 synthase